MRIVLTLAMAVWLVGAANAQQDTPPSECRYDEAGRVDYEACAASAPEGSPWRSLALINLGTQAFRRNDYPAAIRYYDEALPTNGDAFYSDAAFHAYHAATLQAVGRHSEAMAEARRSLAMLRGSTDIPEEARRRFSSVPVDAELIYAAILPVLYAANDPETAGVRDTYMSMPARDWVSWVNRGGVLDQIGDTNGALRANAQALQLEPNHPAVLNSQCYFLGRLGRAAEALPFCERAIVAAPDVAAIRHSRATVLAALGRCEDAESDLAEARRLDPVSAEYKRDLVCTNR